MEDRNIWRAKKRTVFFDCLGKIKENGHRNEGQIPSNS